MENNKSFSFQPFLPTTLLMLVIGWGGLIWTILFTLPTVWQRWGFFVFLIIALTAIALPIAYYMNLRFPSTPPANPSVILRQALWFGIYGSTLAWLQLGSIVTSWTFFGLALGILVIESLIRLFERTRWHPPALDESDFFNPEG